MKFKIIGLTAVLLSINPTICMLKLPYKAIKKTVNRAATYPEKTNRRFSRYEELENAYYYSSSDNESDESSLLSESEIEASERAKRMLQQQYRAYGAIRDWTLIYK